METVFFTLRPALCQDHAECLSAEELRPSPWRSSFFFLLCSNREDTACLLRLTLFAAKLLTLHRALQQQQRIHHQFVSPVAVAPFQNVTAKRRVVTATDCIAHVICKSHLSNALGTGENRPPQWKAESEELNFIECIGAGDAGIYGDIDWTINWLSKLFCSMEQLSKVYNSDNKVTSALSQRPVCYDSHNAKGNT
ncbi:hypothetical protein F2P81_001721 [Scophthalmus maximus]|uniref:Uncharacterized protein n=1 Tax=Scophthalmus maximus TaxID=52904 RepID=A0A6A4TSZ0_SCOMX|nr:hypothetical protein F2P81_001721 [Scophthalmus maximus]